MTSLNPKQEAPRPPGALLSHPNPLHSITGTVAAKLPGATLSKSEGHGRPEEDAGSGIRKRRRSLSCPHPGWPVTDGCGVTQLKGRKMTAYNPRRDSCPFHMKPPLQPTACPPQSRTLWAPPG